GDFGPVAKARLTIQPVSAKKAPVTLTGPAINAETGADGKFQQELDPGYYQVACEAFGFNPDSQTVDIEAGCAKTVSFEIPLGVSVSSFIAREDCGPHIPCDTATSGSVVIWKVEHQIKKPVTIQWSSGGGAFVEPPDQLNKSEVHLNTTGLQGSVPVT